MGTPVGKRYREIALEKYPNGKCAYCGFGIEAVLEVAHLNHDHSCATEDDLALLCPTCHRMHDLGLIPTEVIKEMQKERKPDWSILSKDGPKKAGETRRKNTAKKKHSDAGKKAAATRKSKLEAQTQKLDTG
jgi:hypothetical protein